MSDFWNTLFSSGEGNRTNLELRQLRKGGRPFLLLPIQSTAAATTLELYPAQTASARTLKSLLRFLIRIGLSIGTERVSLPLSPQNGFVKFLTAQCSSPGQLPQFGVLAGNPAHDTQRFIILLFDRNQHPVSIVKAGLSEPAKALIEKEQQFLSSISPNAIGIPKLRAPFADERVKAFALNFAEGESPRSQDLEKLSIVLISWISNIKIALCETAAWQQLENGLRLVPAYPALRQLGDRNIRACIQHGDFAPWNIKAARNGSWTVLDWERGALNGIPGWDWFHYIIQTTILVEHKSVHEIASRIEALLQSETFKNYSKQSGVSEIERELVIAYLIHLIEVIKPAEGLEANRALLTTLSLRWFKDWPTPDPTGRRSASPR
jgi:hypothetical protein